MTNTRDTSLSNELILQLTYIADNIVKLSDYEFDFINAINACIAQHGVETRITKKQKRFVEKIYNHLKAVKHKTKPVNRWEYLIDIHDEFTKPLKDYLDSKGNEGWELVSHKANGEFDFLHNMIFKRKKSL